MTTTTALRTAAVALAVLIPACAASGAAETQREEPGEAATVSPTAVPARFGADDLQRIVLGQEHLEPGMTLDDLTTGFDALVQPVGLLESSVFTQQPGFVDARMTRIGTSGQGSYWGRAVAATLRGRRCTRRKVKPREPLMS